MKQTMKKLASHQVKLRKERVISKKGAKVRRAIRNDVRLNHE